MYNFTECDRSVTMVLLPATGVYDGCRRGEQRVPRTDVHIRPLSNNAIGAIFVYRCPQSSPVDP